MKPLLKNSIYGGTSIFKGNNADSAVLQLKHNCVNVYLYGINIVHRY